MWTRLREVSRGVHESCPIGTEFPEKALQQGSSPGLLSLKDTGLGSYREKCQVSEICFVIIEKHGAKVVLFLGWLTPRFF